MPTRELMLLLAAMSVYEPGGSPSSNEPLQHSTATLSNLGPSIWPSLADPDAPVDEIHWTRADIAGSPFDSYTTRPRTRCKGTGSIVKSMPVSSPPGASSRDDADCSSVAPG